MSRRLTKPLPTSDDTSVLPDTPNSLDLVAGWEALFGVAAPDRMPHFLERAIAWKEQVLEHGDVAPHIQRDLRIIAAQVRAARTNSPATAGLDDRSMQLAQDAPTDATVRAPRTETSSRATPLPPASSQLLPGARLVKTHGGKTHVVEVLSDGMLYEGVRFTSLSAVAKAITGTHWNGLLFFGLRKRKTYPAKAA